MREVKLTGFATIEAPAMTVGDLRELVKYLDKYRVSSDATIDGGYQTMFIEIPTHNVMWIECGDHMANEETYDILIDAHKHE